MRGFRTRYRDARHALPAAPFTRKIARLPSIWWALLVAACGGGGGGGGGPAVTGAETTRQPEKIAVTPIEASIVEGAPLSHRVKVADIHLAPLPADRVPTMDDFSVRVINLGPGVTEAQAAQFFEIRPASSANPRHWEVFIPKGTDVTPLQNTAFGIRVRLDLPSFGDEAIARSETILVNWIMDEVHVYENRPFHQAITRIEGFTNLAIDNSQGDGNLFELDAQGRLWFVGTADNRMLDFEDPADIGENNIYDIHLTYEAENQTHSMVIQIHVHDLAYERDNVGESRSFNMIDFPDVAAVSQPRSDIQPLISGKFWSLPANGPLILTYSLVTPFSPNQPSVPRLPGSNAIYSDFTPITRGKTFRDAPQFFHSLAEVNAIRSYFRDVFANIERYVNIRFVEVADTNENYGDLRIAVPQKIQETIRDDKIWFVYGESPFVLSSVSNHLLGIRFLSDYWGNWHYLITHEIGHALGLKHPWTDDFRRWPDDGRSEQASKDRTDTLLSYESKQPFGLSDLDIRALQYIYGAPGGGTSNLLANARPAAHAVNPEQADLLPASLVPSFGLSSYRPINVSVKHRSKMLVRLETIDGDGKVGIFSRLELAGEHADNFVLLLNNVADRPDLSPFTLLLKNPDNLNFAGQDSLKVDVTIIDPITGTRIQPDITIHNVDRPTTGIVIASGKATVNAVMTAEYFNLYDPDFRITNSHISVKWYHQRTGDTWTKVGDQPTFVPKSLGTYSLEITVTDPYWGNKMVFPTQKNSGIFDVKDRGWDPKTDFTNDGGVMVNGPVGYAIRANTSNAEWFVNMAKNAEIAGEGGDDVFSFSGGIYTITDFNSAGEDRLDVGDNHEIWWKRLYNTDLTVVGRVVRDEGEFSREIMFKLANYTANIDQDDFLVTDTNFIYSEWA